MMTTRGTQWCEPSIWFWSFRSRLPFSSWRGPSSSHATQSSNPRRSLHDRKVLIAKGGDLSILVMMSNSIQRLVDRSARAAELLGNLGRAKPLRAEHPDLPMVEADGLPLSIPLAFGLDDASRLTARFVSFDLYRRIGRRTETKRQQTRRGKWEWRVCDRSGKAILQGVESSRAEAKYKVIADCSCY